MVSAPLGFSLVGVAAVIAAALVVVGLVAGAILQYRRTQLVLAARRAERDAAQARDAEQEREVASREATWSQAQFVAARRRLATDRAALVLAAPRSAVGAGEDERGVLASPAWALPRPLRLDPDAGEIVTTTVETTSTSRPAAAVRDAAHRAVPRTPDGPRHASMAAAIEAIEAPPPGRYVDRDCYRVLGLDFAEGRLDLTLGRTSYFAAFGEAAALELEVAREIDAPDVAAIGGGAEQTLRAVIGDPFDLSRRTAVSSVSALVVRLARDDDSVERGGEAGGAAHSGDPAAEFWLHRRRAVGMVEGQVHVVPTGVFQPAIDDLPDVFERDAAPWWTIVRETAEELLGMWNVDERSLGDDVYRTLEPLASVERAREAGTLRPWLVGIGLDPLSWWVELLAVVVVDAETFDALLPSVPRENGEGSLLGRTRPDGTLGGFPFDDAGLDEALADEHLAPAAVTLLQLARSHRGLLLQR